MNIAYAIDVGSTRSSKASPAGSFGWARAAGAEPQARVTTGRKLPELIRAMQQDADAGAVVTLGVEAPLWLPVPHDDSRLSTGRRGDGARSCFAPAGGYVATLGLHQLAHLVTRLPSAWSPKLSWETWDRTDATRLLLWEAFVSGDAHAKGDDCDAHVRDAATAATEFLRRSSNLTSDVQPDDRLTLSLAGVALLWAGRTTDLAVLREPTLVLRPTSRFEGALGTIETP